MKLNEFFGIDCPEGKLHVGTVSVLQMIERQEELDTDAFMYAYKHLAASLAAIASERAVAGTWAEHPMFGIASTDCKDKHAQLYQSVLKIMDSVFDILMKRIQST